MAIGNNVENIDGYAFAHCASLTSVVIPDSVTNIHEFAFYNCKMIKSVTIGNGVESVGNQAFCKRVKLKEIIISKELSLLIEINPENYPGLLEHKKKFKII